MSASILSRWAELFDAAIALLDQARACGLGEIDWTFGGGTALMLQIEHRESFDVDIFVSDPQRLPFLNPQVQEYDLPLIGAVLYGLGIFPARTGPPPQGPSGRHRLGAGERSQREQLEKKFALDVWYLDNRSVCLDLMIIWLTIRKVIVREGISASGDVTMPKFIGNK